MSTLTLLGLPIGNKDDITLRAIATIENKNYFVSEDTRNFKKLLDALEIDYSDKKFESFHDQSTDSKLPKLISELKQGRDVVYVSDAGSPIISDPAYPLVVKALENGIKVETIPGISSSLVALELSGLPPHPFTFHGFLPRDKGPILEIFARYASIGGTYIFFESPNRIFKTLEFLKIEFPEAMISISRELTKKFEETVRFRSGDFNLVKENLNNRGEFVLTVYFKKDDSKGLSYSGEEEMAQLVLDSKGAKKPLSKLLSKLLSLPAKEVYQKLQD